MNRAAFFDCLRKRESGVFGTSLSQRQVTATDAILDAGAHLPIDHLAHVLGEVYHETGGGMYPVKETVFRSHKDQNPSDATVIARLDAAYRRGRLPWVSAPYWRDGWFGRGGIQLTHRANYAKLSPYVGADLVKNPDKALDPAISAKVAVEGCSRGLFTGKKLADYDGDPFDHFGARAIVNGDKRVTGHDVSDYALAFTKALRAAGYAEKRAVSARKTPSGGEGAANGLMDVLRRIFEALKGGKA
ncbi:glycoside hydrolase family 19 protein [Maritimibacter sp. UBA3975]|uniref:glycoside hydrolase family 19 protein n=1 Tax=Maritimibacter sp. UBA3975 TaxID=1946833 RepID=UPI0025BD18FE|nr:glycoside hydrolase family 19 protein [Maritimibacter sp. UBA3975]|tara:strand:+ start:23379 stop:24113 length:735 start_codon:yes stop_codon:yes gene_type:complete